jgi:uncharacterized protein (DUF983 family)
MTNATSDSTPSPYVTGLRGRCPHCGQGKLFAGLLNLAPSCTGCGLDYSFADSGDGPAVFVCLLAGAVVCAEALWLDVAFALPIWLNLLICAPTIFIVSLALLRLLKGLLVALQYVNKAEEVRYVDKEEQRRWRE